MNPPTSYAKPLIDATEPIVVKIKRTDRDGAVTRNPEKCAVARAVTRTLNGSILGVKIGATKAYVDYGDHIKRYSVSKETREMVRAYDAIGFYPTGVTAALIPVAPSQRLGVQHKPAGKLTKKPGSGKPDVRSDKRPWLRHVNQPVEP